ncbi:MAG: hypothetical protein GX633_08190 [Clostridiales bacterium]|nr:hypothetical protein [Clostridiales bacterium]
MLKISKKSISTFAGNIVSFGVKSDAEEIICEISDSSVARLRCLNRGKYLVIPMNPGSAVLTVRAGQETAVCELNIREAKKSDPEGDFNIYVGDLHSHTSYSDGKLTPYDAYLQVREEGFFDFFTISDHASLEDNDEFFDTFEAAEAVETDDFVAFAGCESEIDLVVENRIGEQQNNGGEMVTVNAEGYVNAESWEEFHEAIGNNPLAFGILAHPQILGYSIKSLWNAFDLEYATTPRMLSLIHGVETGHERSECSLVNERVYSTALDCGYRISPVVSSDHHGVLWGKRASKRRTFLYSEGKSKELFLDAIINARTYSCETGNLRLFYKVNGHNPATILPLTDTYEFIITQSLFDETKPEDRTAYCEIVSDYGEIAAYRDVLSGEERFTMKVKSDTARYFYLKLYSETGEMTWSSPVWTGRAFDKYPKEEFSGKAINNDEFRIAYCSGGEGAGNILVPSLDSCYISDKSTAEIVIDMDRAYTINAVGFFSSAPRRADFHSYAVFLSRYEVETSEDGESLVPASKGMMRIYGSEHISEFEERIARFIKVKALSSVGSETRKEEYKNAPVAIGCVRVYGK